GSFNEGSAEEAQELWEKGLEEIGEEGLDMKLTVSDDESHQKVAEYIKDQLESNLDGMSLEIKKVPFEARLEQEKDVDYDIDRKSTRLNSSHVSISYAVFCLKKKKKIQ